MKKAVRRHRRIIAGKRGILGNARYVKVSLCPTDRTYLFECMRHGVYTLTLEGKETTRDLKCPGCRSARHARRTPHVKPTMGAAARRKPAADLCRTCADRLPAGAFSCAASACECRCHGKASR